MSEKLPVEELLALARKARENAWVPCSRFPVGAAVLTRSGKIYTGCNIENASSGATVCAERTAIFKAVSEGDREIVAVAVIADTPNVCTPCGICRQVIREFGEEIAVIMGNLKGQVEVRALKELLPMAFSHEQMVNAE